MIKPNSKPKLVVMAGFPRSGKTRISSYLARQTLSPRVAFDDLRQMMFDRRYPPDVAEGLNLPRRYSTTKIEEGIVQWTARNMEIAYLENNLGAVVDSTATYNSTRKILFDTPPEIQADKFLFVVEVDPDVLRKRLEKSEGYSPETVDLWLRNWEKPDNNGYETVVLPNNTPRDYKASLKKAIKALGRKRTEEIG